LVNAVISLHVTLECNVYLKHEKGKKEDKQKTQVGTCFCITSCK